MNKKNNNKGFTLAELLIVVAIIAVLVAIAIPVFTSQLEKSREATDVANVRSAYAEVVTSYLSNPTAKNSPSISVAAKQKQTGWQTSPAPVLTYQGGDGTQGTKGFSAKVDSNYTVGISVNAKGVATPDIK